jgi:hypothetical protein
MLRPPTFLSLYGIEYSIHCSPQQLDKEMIRIFPSLNPHEISKLLVIPTWQKTKYDLAAIGPEIEEEKARCLENVQTNESLFLTLELYPQHAT